MKPYFYYLLVILFLSGCTAIDDIKHDHLRSDSWEDDTMAESMDVLKKDYLNARQTRLDKKERQKVMDTARTILTKTDNMQIYDWKRGFIDDESGMPKTFAYSFVHFPPRKSMVDAMGSTFLVVLRKLDGRVLYSDIYEQPAGDSFYKYHEVMKAIERR